VTCARHWASSSPTRSGRSSSGPSRRRGANTSAGGSTSPDYRYGTKPRRRGSPYTLVLTKTDELFTREEEARRQDEADLAWLTASGMVA
jgi:hypothetical protein